MIAILLMIVLTAATTRQSSPLANAEFKRECQGLYRHLDWLDSINLSINPPNRMAETFGLIQELIQQARDGFSRLKICQSEFHPRVWEGIWMYSQEREDFLQTREEMLQLEQFLQRMKILYEYEKERRKEMEKEKKKSTPLAKYWRAWRYDLKEWWDEYHHTLWISVTVLMCVLIFVQNWRDAKVRRDLAQELAEEQDARKLLEAEILKKKTRRSRISMLD